MQPWLTSDVRNHTKEAVSDACLMQLRIKDELGLWFSNKGGHSDAGWLNLSEAEKITKWTTERCSKLNAPVFAKEDYSAVKNYQQEATATVPEYLAEIKRRIEVAVLSGKVSNYRGGTAENNYSAGKIFYVQKRTERAHFLFWPARTNMEGAGSGRGTNIYACWRLRVRIPLCTCDFCCWLLVLWGASRSARKKASCARPHWRKLRVWGLAAGRLFSPIFFDACFAVYNARRLLGSKTWISATLHRQGPRMVSEARNVLFWHHGRSQQTHSHASSKRDLRANSA